MSASLLNGKEVASWKNNEVKRKIQQHLAKGLRAPSLAVILVGTDPASTIYVRNKRTACDEVGITSLSYQLPESTTQDALCELINSLNHSEEVDGILIQLPLPEHIDTPFILEQVQPTKDVDGFHPYNIGRLAQKNPLLRPCTPLGIMNLLDHYKLDVCGQHAVLVGASNIVGRPMGLELLLAGATVTTCHRFTRHLEQHIASADIVIVAAGVIDVVAVDWLRPHHVVLDVGIHRTQGGTIRGDVDFHKAKNKVAWITPVPGGVGPMTISALLSNTLLAAGLEEKYK